MVTSVFCVGSTKFITFINLLACTSCLKTTTYIYSYILIFINAKTKKYTGISFKKLMYTFRDFGTTIFGELSKWF